MRLLISSGKLLLQFATFMALMALISYATTFATAERYSAGNEPSRLFSMVAVQPAGSSSAPVQYQLLQWAKRKGSDGAAAPHFRLPEREGGFALPGTGDFEPFVRFRMVEEADGRQRVAVTLTDDDYVVYSTYITDGVTVTPVNFRIWGPSSAMLALIPATVITWALTRLAAWLWRRRKQVQPPGPVN
jgi:hypothetical protein